jgi:hypothetical protein
VLGITPPTSGDGEGKANGEAAGFAATVVADGAGVGDGDGFEHAASTNKQMPRQRERLRHIHKKGGP